MFRSIVLGFLVLVNSYAYEGCGGSNKEALASLSTSIYVSVEDNFKKNTKTSSSNSLFSLDTFYEDVSVEMKQTSFVELSGVEFKDSGSKKCATIDEENLRSSAMKSFKDVKMFSVKDLPEDNAQNRAQMIDKQINKIKFVQFALKNSLTEDESILLDKKAKDLLQQVDFAIVSFHSESPYTSVKLSGDSKSYPTSKKIILKAGKYSFTATNGDDHCPTSGEFTLENMGNKQVDIAFEKYPTISFSSNKSTAVAYLQDTRIGLDKNEIIKQCSGTISWRIEYEDQKKSGSFDLSPGASEDISESFLSQEDEKNIIDMIGVYSSSNEININYGYASTDNNEWDDEKRIEFRYFKNNEAYKYGLGLNLGAQKSWSGSNIHEVELTLNGRVQLTDKIDGTLLHLGNSALIPYIGASAGFDLNPYMDSEVPEEFVYMFRLEAGTNLLFTKRLGLNLNFSYDLGEKEDYIVSMGLVFGFQAE